MFPEPGGRFSGSECYPRLVAVSPVVIFLAVTCAPHRCRGRRIIPACHDTDRCADSYVSRRVSGPKTWFSCHDTDRVGKWSVSRQAGGKQAAAGKQQAVLGIVDVPPTLPRIIMLQSHYRRTNRRSSSYRTATLSAASGD